MKVQLTVVVAIAVLIIGFDRINNEPSDNLNSPGYSSIEAFGNAKRIFADSKVQEAYERCHKQTSDKFDRDNANLNSEQRSLLKGSLPDVCKDLISGACAKSASNRHCQDIIQPYLS